MPPKLRSTRCGYFGSKLELLTANAGFEHQSARAHGEDSDAVVVLCGLRHTVLEGNRRCTRRNLVIAALEAIERRPVLEEYDLAVGLAAELQADCDLRHAGRADGGAALEDGAVAGSTADADSALGDLGKDGVGMSLIEEGVDARIRLLEGRDRIERPLFVGRIPTRNGGTDHANGQARDDKT